MIQFHTICKKIVLKYNDTDESKHHSVLLINLKSIVISAPLKNTLNEPDLGVEAFQEFKL